MSGVLILRSVYFHENLSMTPCTKINGLLTSCTQGILTRMPAPSFLFPTKLFVMGNRRPLFFHFLQNSVPKFTKWGHLILVWVKLSLLTSWASHCPISIITAPTIAVVGALRIVAVSICSTVVCCRTFIGSCSHQRQRQHWETLITQNTLMSDIICVIFLSTLMSDIPGCPY